MQETCDLSTMVAKVLARVVHYFDSCHTPPQGSAILPWIEKVSCFTSAKVPAISVESYLGRIRQYTHCTDSCFVLAFIYIDRLLQKNPDFALSGHNVHRYP